ncbi:MAG: hypothetical protein QOH21_3427 [Acidobacteriota bacterium]|jgi:hypothetical protein|nr:hypothetical protein [Acidobacteriota bacterium]
MVSSDVTAGFLRHAGLDGDSSGDGSPRVSDGTWPLHAAASDDFRAAVNDFIGLLGRLNVEVNGAVPSETASSDKHADIPRDIAYAVVLVLQELRTRIDSGAPDETGDFFEAAWSIEMAWSQVLAGDIDDVAENLEQERAARRPGRRASP